MGQVTSNADPDHVALTFIREHGDEGAIFASILRRGTPFEDRGGFS